MYFFPHAGQEQGFIGGGFNSRESFIGEMSQLNLYDRVLSDDERLLLADSVAGRCVSGQGNVVTWTDVVDKLVGDVRERKRSYCLGEWMFCFVS